MPHETEIKLKIRDVKALQRILKRLGAKPVGSATGRVSDGLPQKEIHHIRPV